MKEKRRVQIIIIIAVIASFVIANVIIVYKQVRSTKFVEDSNQYCYQIEEVYRNNDALCIDGWFFTMSNIRNSIVNEKQEDDIFVGIVPIDSDGDPKCIFGTTEKHDRNDVGDYFRSEFDYSHSGFTAAISDKNYESDVCYQVFVKPVKREEKAVLLNAYIYQDQLYYVNPLEVPQLDDANDDIIKVISNGNLIGYEKDYNIYLYQNEWSLIWIAPKEYLENKDNDVMQFQIETTQFERLPKSRTDKGYYWDNIGFSIHNAKEISTNNSSKYYICEYALPDQYSISYAWIGLYIDEWKWQICFRPLYNLK